MARPRQKRKQKSSLPTIRQKPKSKRINIKANPIVAANWDKTLTLTQNYRRLGLASTLNASTGGSEPRHRAHDLEEQESGKGRNARDDPLAIKPGKVLDRSMSTTRVVRDDDGNIISVLGDERDAPNANPLNDPLNDLSEQEDGFAHLQASRYGIITELESSSRMAKPKRIKVQSQSEKDWLERLRHRWKGDFEAMSRDVKLNPMQHSAGDLRKRVRIWEDNRQDVSVTS